MKDISDFLRSGVEESIAETQDALIAHTEEYALKEHLMFELQGKLEELNEKLEIEHNLHIEDRKDADRQKIVDRKRFIITTIISTIAAIAAIIGTTVGILAYLA